MEIEFLLVCLRSIPDIRTTDIDRTCITGKIYGIHALPGSVSLLFHNGGSKAEERRDKAVII